MEIDLAVVARQVQERRDASQAVVPCVPLQDAIICMDCGPEGIVTLPRLNGSCGVCGRMGTSLLNLKKA